MSRFNQLNTTSKALAALAALLATALVGFLVFAAASAPAHAKPARQTATTDNGVSTAESEYAANSYDGAAAPDSVRFIDHTATSNLLIVAPHAVNHVRAGQPKEADMYTGGIAEMVAQKTGASVLTTTGKVSDWGDNWDTRDDEFTRILRSIPTNVRVLDLHGMADGYGIDESIGLGPGRPPQISPRPTASTSRSAAAPPSTAPASPRPLATPSPRSCRSAVTSHCSSSSPAPSASATPSLTTSPLRSPSRKHAQDQRRCSVLAFGFGAYRRRKAVTSSAASRPHAAHPRSAAAGRAAG